MLPSWIGEAAFLRGLSSLPLQHFRTSHISLCRWGGSDILSLTLPVRKLLVAGRANTYLMPFYGTRQDDGCVWLNS